MLALHLLQSSLVLVNTRLLEGYSTHRTGRNG
jgi:TnpA family transposase